MADDDGLTTESLRSPSSRTDAYDDAAAPRSYRISRTYKATMRLRMVSSSSRSPLWSSLVGDSVGRGCDRIEAEAASPCLSQKCGIIYRTNNAIALFECEGCRP
jgi:hypothetical protein